MRVLIADDHAVTRRGIRELLRDTFPSVEIGEAADGPTAVARARECSWDLVLLDVQMPGDGVLSNIAELRRAQPKVPILVLTGLPEVEYVVQTLKAGANGFLHKHRAADDLIEAIRKVSSGGRYLDPESAIAVATALGDDGLEQPHDRLSKRELDIFRLIAVGKSVKEIAALLGLSDKTVATYLGRVREKTGLSSHVDIARYALRHRLVQ